MVTPRRRRTTAQKLTRVLLWLALLASFVAIGAMGWAEYDDNQTYTRIDTARERADAQFTALQHGANKSQGSSVAKLRAERAQLVATKQRLADRRAAVLAAAAGAEGGDDLAALKKQYADLVVIPDVSDMSLQDAEAKLADAELKTESGTRTSAVTLPPVVSCASFAKLDPDVVLKTSPEAGVRVPKGSIIYVGTYWRDGSSWKAKTAACAAATGGLHD